MTFRLFLLIFIGVALNAAAQLFIKSGVGEDDLFNLKKGIANMLFGVIFEPHIFLGLVCYVISVGVWIFALSKTPVSTAYPMLSIGYVINLFLAYWLFGEMITANKITGISMIILGVYFISR